MDFVSAVKTCLNKYAAFSGRAARSEFWWFILFVIIARIVANILDRIVFGAGVHINSTTGMVTVNYGYIGILVGLGLLVPSIAVAARRLHDIGKSGWWQLIGLIPIVGWIIVIIWYAKVGEGPNAYGQGPDGPVT